MFNLSSIKTKFLLSYIVFATVLCTAFILIFYVAETKMEQALVKSRLLQQLQLSIEDKGEQSVYHANDGITIYQIDYAPQNLKQIANDSVQEIKVLDNGHLTELHFLKYQYNNQDYILSYLESAKLLDTEYPVLTIFEDIEDIIYKALISALALSILLSFMFAYLSSKAIIKPILDLKDAVKTDHQELGQLTHMPSEIGVLARTIEDKNRQLSGFLCREQLFSGDVSHELRTPLTIIMGASEVLNAQLDDDSPLKEFSSRIYTTAQNTSELISALLLLSRAPEKLDHPRTSINDVVQKEVESLSYLIKFKPVHCIIHADNVYYAFVRPELLKMAVGNLIKNAFQYTDEGEVTITIDDTKITIDDTGDGIPEEKLPMLYKRFERIEPKNHVVEGTGLGLSIVQRVMTHLDWKLSYKKNESAGISFTIHYKPKC